MTIRMSSRVAALLLLALVSGCSSSMNPWASDRKAGSPQVADECRWNRSKCLYNGSYEPGEKDYAEEEAARLNQAESARIRGGFR